MIIMTEEYWANSQFSFARYYGGIVINGKHYAIVNKFGVTLRELSDSSSEYYVGDDNKAIEPGEPADLVLDKWVPIYRAVGREKCIELVKNGVSYEEAKRIAGL